MPLENPTEVRPWGRYRNLADENGFLIKLIEVDPGKRLSLQRHALRSEYWTVVSGMGLAEIAGASLLLRPGTAVHIPRSAIHRLTADASGPLLLLELQTGECREDDIERLEDDFGRI